MATMLNPNAIPDGSITSAKLDKAYAIEENLPPLSKGTGENSVQMSNCTASGTNSFAEGDYTFAIGNNSHAEGYDTYSNNPNSHAEGNNTYANGDSSHAEGHGNTASGMSSHVEGSSNQSIGESSHAEGNETEASGDHSHSEGRSTIAKGEDSHAEGCASQANKACSHAEGIGTIADGDYSHSEGLYTKASNEAEHAEGKYNLSTLGKTMHSVGIGEADDIRMNAFEIFNDGSVLVKDIGGYDGTNGTSAKTIQTVIGEKQDKTAFDSHNNDNTRHITAAERTKWNAKQDAISDLADIRSGASKGATALQSYTETDPIYTADKPSLALKTEIPDVSGKADKTAIVTETEGSASYAISPNVLTKLGTLASSVTLSLDTSKEDSGVTNVYDIIFVTPTDAPSITWPEGITWVGGSAPTIAGGKTYEVSIMDNLATYGEY